MLILPDSKGISFAYDDPISGNYNNAFELTKNSDDMFASLEQSNIAADGLFLNAETDLYTISFKKCLLKHSIFPS